MKACSPRRSAPASVLAVLAVVALLAFSGPAAAQDPLPGVTIAVVDMERLLQESDAAINIQEQLDVEREAFAAEVTRLEEELRASEQELRRQRTVLAQDAFNEQLRAFEERAATTQREVQARNRALEAGLNQALSVLLNNAREVVAEIAQERGANVVLARRQVLLADRSLELTEAVMAALNERLPSVEVTIPEIELPPQGE